MPDTLKDIKELISNNQTSEALMILREVAKADHESEITILTLIAEFNKIEIEENRGVLTSDERDRKRNQININTLKAANQLFNSPDKRVHLPGVYTVKPGKGGKFIIIALTALTIILFTVFAIMISSPLENDNYLGLMVMIGSMYGGAICFVALIVVLVVKAIYGRP